MTGLAGTSFGGNTPQPVCGHALTRQRALRPLATLALALAFAISAPAQTVAAISVPLARPTGVAFDAQGNLYVAETNNHAVRKVDPTGNLTTVAGTGVQGFAGDGGPATQALLDSPSGVAVDASGSLYLADTHNHRIREIAAATGLITTLAGTGAPGFSGDGGPATSATLNLPTAVAVDSSGNVFFSDTGNHRIREIVAATGLAVTVAGDGVQGFSGDGGPATAADIDSPDGLALGPGGQLYLADTHNQRLRAVTLSTGLITTLAGTGTLGFSGEGTAAATAALALPRGVTADASGNLIFADTANHRIRRIDASTGTITTVAGDGTQGFSGDGGPATSASLDSPRATVLTPTGLVTLADTGNQRVRQVLADSTLTTVAGLGTAAPATLQLAAAPVIPYGTGTLTATLSAATPATGSIAFLDETHPTPAILGTAALTGDAATFSTATLSAGVHILIATYAGDPTHAAAQSPAVTVSISPAPVTATATPVTTLFGAPIPALTGTVTGILPQDAAQLGFAFVTPAAQGSPAGAYPITATLTGAPAANYAVTMTPGSGAVTIGKAGSTAVLTAAATSLTVGSALTLVANIASATTGAPTGQVTLLDGVTPLQSVPLSKTGVGVFDIVSLTAGTHTFTATYAGDANFLASTSPPTVELVTTPVATTFTLAATGSASQTVVSGSAASFTLAIAEQGNGLPSPIQLAASGLPLGASASFNPAYIVPGALNTTVTLTIQTPAAATAHLHWPQTATGVFAALLLPWFVLRRRRAWPLLLLVSLICSGCGDRVSTEAASATTTTTYPVTVTATATSATGAILTQTLVVTLVIQ